MIVLMYSNAEEVARVLEMDGVRVDIELPKIVAANAQKLKLLISGHAMGRPGPNRITGAYWGSWEVRRNSPNEYEVGTDEPQGFRLEMGFHGIDSLQRDYDQPPFPHVGPSVDLLEPIFFLEVMGVLPE